MAEKTSTTNHDSFRVEDWFGVGGHYETTISDGERESVGLGRTSEEAEDNASSIWHDKYDD